MPRNRVLSKQQRSGLSRCFYLLRFASSLTLPGCGWLRRPGGRANVRVTTARRVPPGAAKYDQNPSFSSTGLWNRSKILLCIVKPASTLFFFKSKNLKSHLLFKFHFRPPSPVFPISCLKCPSFTCLLHCGGFIRNRGHKSAFSGFFLFVCFFRFPGGCVRSGGRQEDLARIGTRLWRGGWVGGIDRTGGKNKNIRAKGPASLQPECVAQQCVCVGVCARVCVERLCTRRRCIG